MTQEQREEAVLEHIKKHGHLIIRHADRAKMTGLSHSTFTKTAQRLVSAGLIRCTTRMHGNLIEIVENAPPPPQPVERVRCPRCETVNCERHTASRLTTGRISPVYARKK